MRIDDELAAIAALRAAGNLSAAHQASLALVRTYPDDVRAVMAAAGACDRLGLEHDAVVHYDRAWQLGVPAAELADFVICYGSTLRNVGRLEEAVALLGEAAAARPDSAATRAFLALALHSSGHATLALATMLEAALAAAAQPDGFGRYARALGEYQAELVAAALGDPAPIG